jgi:hypothetical protein
MWHKIEQWITETSIILIINQGIRHKFEWMTKRAKYLESPLVWDFMRRYVVISYRRFRITRQSHLHRQVPTRRHGITTWHCLNPRWSQNPRTSRRKPEITQNGCCLHHSYVCAFNQNCTVHTSENHFQNKLSLLFPWKWEAK